LKIKSRYLLIESKDGGRELIEKAVSSFVGENGVSVFNFKVLFSFEGRWVAKCYLKGLEEIICAIALKARDGGKPVVVRVVKISGTIKALTSS
jgi:RNase P/RNase MRP subunit POP5